MIGQIPAPPRFMLEPLPDPGDGVVVLPQALVQTTGTMDLVAAEQHAATKGFSVRFGSEDLRAMALSLFIQHAREGGLR